MSRKPKIDLFLASLPFLAFVAAYWYASANGMAYLPTIPDMAEKVKELAFTPDFRTGRYLLWEDTLISLQRLGLGLGIASCAGFLVGINLGLSRNLNKTFSPFLQFLGTIPPMAVLTLILVWLGTEETAKIALIFCMTFFSICGNLFLATQKIPIQIKVKAITLGASKFDLAYRVILPLILPVFLNQVRLSIGPAITALIASEAIASQAGLGFRIFMLTRTFSMDGIIPYVLWITFIGWFASWTIGLLLSWKFQWYLRTND